MIELAHNRSLHLLCCVVSGVRTAAENEKLVAAIEELDREGSAKNHPVAFLLELSPGSEPPDAYWRRRFANQRKSLKAPRVFTAIVSTSKVQRGVLTAMNWISPLPAHVESVHHATREDAAAWIERVQGAPVDATRQLLGLLVTPLAKAT